MADGSDSKVAEAAELAAVLAQFDSQVADGTALWTQLEQLSQALPHHHSAALESSAAREKEELMAAKLLGEADLDQHSAHMRWADDALVSVFGTDAGLHTLQITRRLRASMQRTDLKPFLAAALDPSQPPSLHAQHSLYDTTDPLWALVTGAGEGGAGRANRCHWLLRQPVAAALVQCVGAGGTAASQPVAAALVQCVGAGGTAASQHVAAALVQCVGADGMAASQCVGVGGTAALQGASGLLVDLLRWTRDPDDAAGLMLEVLMEVDAAQRGGGGGGGDASTVVLRYADLVARCCAIGDKVRSAEEANKTPDNDVDPRARPPLRVHETPWPFVVLVSTQESGTLEIVVVSAQESGTLEILLPFVAAAPSGARFILASHSPRAPRAVPPDGIDGLYPNASTAEYSRTSGLSASLLELADVGARGTALGTGALRATAEVLALAAGAQQQQQRERYNVAAPQRRSARQHSFVAPLCAEEAWRLLGVGARMLARCGQSDGVLFMRGTQPSEKLALAQRLLSIAASYMKMGVGAGQEGARLAGMSAVADFARSSAWALQMVLEDNALCHAWLNLNGGGGGMSAALKATVLHSVARVFGPPTLAPTPPLSPVPEAEGPPTLAPTPPLSPVAEAEAERTGEMISDASETSAADIEVEVEEAPAPDARVGRSDAADTELSELRHRLWLRLGGCNDRAQAHAQQQGAAAAAAAAPAAAAAAPSASPVGLLMALVRLPVAETRHAAMDVLRCAAHQRGGWALQDMMAYGGLVEFLASGMGTDVDGVGASAMAYDGLVVFLASGMDTDVDVGGQEGMEWKFSLVESIMRCPHRAVLGQPTLDLLERILRNGPFGPPITLPFSAPQ
ncbi:hypothetical protein JKP88DRAFT_347480 [Tribonema minus]|uniref:Uncharacterized protein n=1 Tax=Tribonema minus TaxID=303371 RepID=A0A835ZGU2_9STRA|nr:hypothetical protein JKP88DRAFT_347480 [Tribonema minus]